MSGLTRFLKTLKDKYANRDEIIRLKINNKLI